MPQIHDVVDLSAYWRAAAKELADQVDRDALRLFVSAFAPFPPVARRDGQECACQGKYLSWTLRLDSSEMTCQRCGGSPRSEQADEMGRAWLKYEHDKATGGPSKIGGSW